MTEVFWVESPGPLPSRVLQALSTLGDTWVQVGYGEVRITVREGKITRVVVELSVVPGEDR